MEKKGIGGSLKRGMTAGIAAAPGMLAAACAPVLLSAIQKGLLGLQRIHCRAIRATSLSLALNIPIPSGMLQGLHDRCRSRTAYRWDYMVRNTDHNPHL